MTVPNNLVKYDIIVNKVVINWGLNRGEGENELQKWVLLNLTEVWDFVMSHHEKFKNG